MSRELANLYQYPVGTAQPQIGPGQAGCITFKRNPGILYLYISKAQIPHFPGHNRFQTKSSRGYKRHFLLHSYLPFI